MAAPSLGVLNENLGYDIENVNCSLPLQKFFHQCVATTVQYVGFFIGVSSVFLWLMAHLILFKIRQSDGTFGIKTFFYLINICIADIFNLVGAALTEQLGTQILTAVFFVFMDVLFFIQFFCARCACCGAYCKKYKNSCATCWWKQRRRQQSKQVYCLIVPWLMSGVYLFSKFLPTYLMGISHPHVKSTGRVLLSVLEDRSSEIGYSLGICSTALYWISRFPTIYDGWSALSPPRWRKIFYHMFCALGGVMYGLSIVTQSVQLDFILSELPWLMGSLGLAGLDLGIMLLSCWNKKGDNKNNISNVMALLEEDEDVEPGSNIDEDNHELVTVKPINTKYMKEIRKNGKNFEELEMLQKKPKEKKTGLLVEIPHDDGYLAEREDSDEETEISQFLQDSSAVPHRWDNFQRGPAILAVKCDTGDSSDDMQTMESSEVNGSNPEADKKWIDSDIRSRPEADWDF